MKKTCLIFTLLLFYSFTLTASPAFAEKPEGRPEEEIPAGEECTTEVRDRDSRPAPCETCIETDFLAGDCASSFDVFDELEYQRNEGPEIEKEWGGTVTINPKEVTIPFVGKKQEEGGKSAAPCHGSTCDKKGECDSPCTPRPYAHGGCMCIDPEAGKVGESEEKYLADYFEGTNEYYKNYGNQTTITNYQGILRKLTPFEYQNQLKKQLISRAEEEAIHNYKVEYIGRLCWDAPFWLDALKRIAEKLGLDLPDVTHYCLFEDLKNHPDGWAIIEGYRFGSWITNWIPKVNLTPEWLNSLLAGKASYKKGFEVQLSELADHTPPDPNEEKYKENFSEYQKDFLKWKESDGGKWYRLWQATPMVNREDTPGKIIPYLGIEHPKDNLEIPPEDERIEKVPHVARLYELTQRVNQALLPAGFAFEMPSTTPPEQTTPVNACLKPAITSSDPADSLCCEEISANLEAWEKFQNPNYEPCQGRLPGGTPINPTCDDWETLKVSRGIGVNLLHPYLDQIWGYTGNASGGVFNIFRPAGAPQFEDIEAESQPPIYYNYSDGDVSPQQGHFYFPHLGGVQLSKEWVVTKALWPYESEEK